MSNSQYTSSFPQQQGRIRLVRTRRPGLSIIELDLGHEIRRIGELDETCGGTFRCKRSPKHLHRKTNSLGINSELLERFDFRWISISYSGAKLVTTKRFFLAHCRPYTFSRAGFEKQLFLPISKWGREVALQYELDRGFQGNFFASEAAA